MNILVTGGAGYIGSHTTQCLIESGFSVVVFDNLSTGFKCAIPKGAKFVEGDIRCAEDVNSLFERFKFDAVIHFAAKLNVKESTERPLDYYQTNVGGIINLLNACEKFQVEKVVFSSTAALFGDSVQDRNIREDDIKQPLNPYGWTKLFSEKILEDQSKAGKLRYVALRYFNVAGAADNILNGQRTADAFHLIHIASQAAVGKRHSMAIYGSDYPTFDGTCVRDYIHVQDLADIHVHALNYLLGGGLSDCFNCGYGVGYSVRQVVDATKQVSGVDFMVKIEGRRPGDAASLVADGAKLREKLGWIPKRNSLDLICNSAVLWEKKLMEEQSLSVAGFLK